MVIYAFCMLLKIFILIQSIDGFSKKKIKKMMNPQTLNKNSNYKS